MRATIGQLLQTTWGGRLNGVHIMIVAEVCQGGDEIFFRVLVTAQFVVVGVAVVE